MLNCSWDKEYATQWAKEQAWLKEHGFRYTYIKEVNGITTWKYTKNTDLFKSLLEFYRSLEK